MAVLEPDASMCADVGCQTSDASAPRDGLQGEVGEGANRPSVPNRIVVAGQGEASGLLAGHLAVAGYDTRVAESVQAVLHQIVCRWPDVIVVCVPFGDDDAVSLIRRICSAYRGAVLVVGPTHAPEAIVPLLDAGADDYVSHRVTRSELLARIRVRMRHAVRVHDAVPPDDSLTVPALHLDQDQLTISCEDRQAHLSHREMAILRLLALHLGKMVETSYLVDEIWGAKGPSEETILRTYVKLLRRKLAQITGSRTALVCVRGRGYRLDLPATAIAAGAPG